MGFRTAGLLRSRTLWMGRAYSSVPGGDVIFSGIQPSGTPHLGNYFGAIRQWVEGPKTLRSLFSIADLHALTGLHDPSEMRSNIIRLTAGLLASGLDPKACILFQQSQVQEHTELSWILGSLSSVQSLTRMTQYRDKTRGVKESPLGLLIYPVLQSADILLYKGTRVPIGEDNIQNLELARSIARTFNRTYDTSLFPEPFSVLSESSKIKSLRNPANKMSKSDKDTRSCIYISDPPELIREKCKKAVTDCQGSLSYDPVNRPGVSNLILIHASILGVTPQRIVEEYSNLDTGGYKLLLADALSEHFRPIRERFGYYLKHEHVIHEVLKDGSDAAREIASSTMKEVKSIIGFT
uniref:tryptophan--tRNA ligase n=1 Tax=Caligus rogercresseyi TaxID=217165 RepID=C1BP85_CALRO|nr:Tryptophanyl-tRNA synthetase, mitochondrial precursor [Caligus rogercresseyi]|eukprot:TRINITY_DN8651_c0_g1_i1.p1 TRINITY_DN8651_c0_g1~~TRINITY_DN8651_c0_g1_i1.p1  ORF type:complete len:352 (-),score=52.73 TRINITY_DN8651_c0_g1_i1:61-1116(-)